MFRGMSTTTNAAMEVPGTEPGAGRRFSEPARRLLDAADELFYDRGVDATTVREITSACGLSPAALYNHFSSKEELLYVLVRHRHARIEEDVMAAQRAVAGDPLAELGAIVRVYVRTHIGNRRGVSVANQAYRHLTGENLDEVVAIRRRLRDRVVSVLREGARVGVFDICGGSDSRSLTLTASTVLEMCINCSQWLRRGGSMGVDELEDRFVQLTLRLVGAAPHWPPGSAGLVRAEDPPSW